MSFYAVQRVRDLRVTRGPAFAVLAYLADRADRRGRCWPSIPRIAAETGYSDRTVRRALRALEAIGEIAVEPRPGRSSIVSLGDHLVERSTPDRVSPVEGLSDRPPRTECPPTPDRVTAITLKEPTENLSLSNSPSSTERRPRRATPVERERSDPEEGGHAASPSSGRVEMALGLLADDDLEHRIASGSLGSVLCRPAYRSACLRARRAAHVFELVDLARRHRDWTPEALADSVRLADAIARHPSAREPMARAGDRVDLDSPKVEEVPSEEIVRDDVEGLTRIAEVRSILRSVG